MARKRGKLAKEEEQFIRDGISRGLDIHSIAIQLNRTDNTIKKFCDKNNLTYSGMSEEVFDDTILRAKLKKKPFWAEVIKQFSPDELEYFEATWVRMMRQFREDILYSEELQVKQWITLELMGNKVMEDRRQAANQLERLENMLTELYMVPADQRDADAIVALESEAAMVRNAQGSFTTEHSKILDKIERIQRDLRAVRADRVKKVEDSKSSWAGFISSLEDEELRQRVGEDVEINRQAKDRAIHDLAEYHTYEDGLVDQPFLNSDTVKKDE